MKKILAILVLCLLMMCGTAWAAGKKYDISIADYTTTTGTTTEQSGTSVMIVNNNSGITCIYIGDYESEGTNFAVQLKTVSGISPSVGAVAAGNWSGTTGSVRYKESMVNNQNYWDKASGVSFWTIMLSGNSLYQTLIRPTAMGYISFEWISGATPMNQAVFEFKAKK